MQHPEEIPAAGPQDTHSRDFILVVTTAGDIETLQVHLIHKVTPGPSQQSSHVYFKSTSEHKPVRMLMILEPAEDFQRRCKNLLHALVQQDEDKINKYFAPPVVI